jgi:hypothetical protein
MIEFPQDRISLMLVCRVGEKCRIQQCYLALPIHPQGSETTHAADRETKHRLRLFVCAGLHIAIPKRLNKPIFGAHRQRNSQLNERQLVPNFVLKADSQYRPAK